MKLHELKDLTPADIHRLADLKGVPWDDDPAFLALTKRITGREHLDDLNQVQLLAMQQHLRSLT